MIGSMHLRCHVITKLELRYAATPVQAFCMSSMQQHQLVALWMSFHKQQYVICAARGADALCMSLHKYVLVFVTV